MSKARWLVGLAAVAAAGTFWWMKPAGGPDGPAITERVQQADTGNGGSLSARLIPDTDLPPEGSRSLFDHLIAQNDGLPYPFEKLVDLIRKQNPSGDPPLVLMIPDGRSLLKASADYQHPRVLVAADFQAPNNDASLGLAPRGQLFLGFVENAAEIEVLSYNEAAGRFEFQLVQDYRAEGARRIVYARRQICTTCHQGSAPIFPQRPWNETNGQPETAAKIVAARGDDAPYLAAPLNNDLGVPERFDQLTDIGNFIPATQRVWIDGCGAATSEPSRGGAACRRQMLKLALLYLWNPAEFDPQSAATAQLRELQAKDWPAGGIAVADGDLRNRDPLGAKKGIKGFFRDLFAEKPKPGAGAKDNEDLRAFDQLPKLPADLDPLTRRPPQRTLSAQDLDGAFGIAALLSESDFKQLEVAAAYQLPRLLAAVDSLDAKFFEPAPLVRATLMNALLAANKQPKLSYCCLDVSEMSPPVAAGTPPVEIGADSPLRPFEQYCFACHRGNPAQRLNFMAGATEQEVLENLKAKSEIRDALDWERYKGTDKENKLMPPADAPQRARLMEALEDNPKLLEQMSAVVPGLFDF